MEKRQRGLWLSDGLLVVVYLVLVALVTPALREFHTITDYPNGWYTPLGEQIIPPGGSVTQSTYRANNWQQLEPTIFTMILVPMLRRRPLVFASAVCVGQGLVGSVHASGDTRYELLLAAVACLVSVALAWPRRTSLKAAALILAGAVFSMTAFPPGSSEMMQTHVVVVTLLTLVAWLIGSSIRERRAGAVRQRADAAAQAVANERLRIARELHDMIAHSIGIIAIQAGMGNRVIGTQPAEAQKALHAIEETSRDTLSQLRRTLTALRHGENAETPTDPAPGLADLDKLVASTKHAGVLAIVERIGIPRPLPGEIDLAAYRIVQESVTNVVRHSGARTCRVRIEYQDSAVAIAVSDDGHGVLGSGGTGFGLVGMRERVTLVHGAFEAGPRPGGGFRVSATLPVPGGFETTYGGAKTNADTGTGTGTGTGTDPDPRADTAPDPNPAVAS
ncbi:sensor histidine kinase [Catenulispora acidiphila]|uniref:sensor histidine kinase n=1 Tax=Catenulispora acidiphila TaxID=304895 RepID=UPI00031D5ED8|nr:sensor histidine kinase [Catenulispora acidiphila]